MNSYTLTEEKKKPAISKLNEKDSYSLLVEEDIIRYPNLGELPSKLGDKLRPIKYLLTAIRAELKYVLRKLGRELKNLFRLFDLFILFLLLGIGLVAFFLVSVYAIPFVLSVMPESIVGDTEQTIWGEQICKFYDINKETITYSADNCDIPGSEKASGWPLASGYVDKAQTKPKFTGLNTYIFNLWTSDTTLRISVGVIGGLGVIMRLLFKSEIDKFRDKVNARKNVTYVFGSTIYAEKFLSLLTHTFAYADEAALISDAKYLWVERLAGLLDTYISSENLEEFEKSNLYTILGFANAKRIYILTDNTDRNQNILTNIRSLRPDVPIYILSQYTPDYLKGDLVKDENLHIIDDMDITREGLVKSLSLDIKFPLCSEVNVPRTYVGKSALYLTNEVPDIEILAVKRPHLDDDRWDLILPEKAILQRTDRIILNINSDFKMKEVNRIITEMPIRYLADLGELKYEKTKNKYIKASITEVPGRTLLLEPKGARKSWIRRIIGISSLILIVSGILIGRNLISGIPKTPIDLILVKLSLEFILFFSGVICFFVYRSLHPILLKGIVEIDKFDKTYLRRTKSFKRGKNITADISKMKELLLVIVEPKRGKKQFRNYYLVDADNNKLLIVSILWRKIEKNEKKNEYLKRFENRLESYTELSIVKDYKEGDETVIIDEDPDEDDLAEEFDSVIESNPENDPSKNLDTNETPVDENTNGGESS